MDDPAGWLNQIEYSVLWFYKECSMTLKVFSRVEFVGQRHDELSTGDVGYIIEDYGDGNYEVEFSSPDGSTRVQAVISENELALKPT
jgi:Domain of unknown function (DUF4926)